MGAATAKCYKPSIDDDMDFTTDGQSKARKAVGKSKAEELFVCEGAHVVIISDKGEEAFVQSGSFVVLKLMEPRPLAVFFVGKSMEDKDNAFYYPVLHETPVLMSADHILTVHAGDGDVFGIKLPKELPGGQEQHFQLVDVLSKECSLQVQQTPDTADKVAGKIINGGMKLVSGVDVAAGYLSKGIAKSGAFARSKLAQKDAVEISEPTKASLSAAKFATGGAVVIAGSVADGLMETALVLGKEAGRLTTRDNGAGNENSNAGGRESGAMRVGKASAVAGLQVFDALMRAGDQLLDQTKDEATATVAHRYGKDAADVTKDTLGVAKDIKDMSDMVGKRAVARFAQKAALYTAKGMIEEHMSPSQAGQGTNAAKTNLPAKK